MSDSGKNVNSIKKSNRSVLLNLLYFGGANSRKNLAIKSGLTAAAITTLINELIMEGAVIETKKNIVDGRLGRCEQFVDINYKALYVLGIYFGVQTFEIRITRLDSKSIDFKEYSISQVDMSLFGSTLSDIIKGFLEGSSVPQKSVVGIGVTLRGIVDSKKGISIDSYGILPNNLEISGSLFDCIGIPVVVDNNVRAMARSDIILRHARPSQSTLFIKYGPGIGGALLIGQNSFVGSTFRAVELRHSSIGNNAENCICGKRDCLETAVSYKYILKKSKYIFSHEQTPVLFNICNENVSNVTIKNILLAYEQNDIGIESIMQTVADYIGLSVSNCVSLFDPETVLLASEAFKCEKFIKSIQNKVNSLSVNSKPKYFIVTNCKMLDKNGAVSIAINNFLATGGQVLRVNKVNCK